MNIRPVFFAMIFNPLIPCLWPFQPTAMSVLVDHDNSRTDLNFQDVSINSFLILCVS